MQKLTKLFLLIILCFLALRTEAQVRYVALESRIENAPYIFEGKVSSKETYEKGGSIYTSYLVEVQTIFKGNITSNEVEIIIEGGFTVDKGLVISHELRLEVGNEGIFFCGKSANANPKNSNNRLHLGIYNTPQGFIQKIVEPNGDITARDYFHSYQELEQEVYQKIENLTKQKRRKIGLNLEEQTLAKWLADKGIIKTLYQPNEFAIKYSIENATITGTITQTLDFDVFAETEWITSEIFAEGGLIIEYDTTILGSNIALNGNIIGNKEQVILSSDYTLSFSDEHADEVKILAAAIANPTNLYTLTQTAEKLCHISLNILNPTLLNLNTQIHFDENAMQGLSKYYDAGQLYNFPYVIAEDSVMASLAITIDSIRPLQLNAGVRDTLTIYGSNFGMIQGLGKVEFRNADDGGATWLVAGKKDSVLWSDNVIKVRVPSVEGVGAAVKGTAGTGKVRITPTAGSAKESTETLTVGYAWLNARYNHTAVPTDVLKPFPIQLIDHSSLDSAKGYVFQYNANFKANTPAKQCFESALRAWRCATNINFSVAKDTTLLDTLGFDGICLVKWENPADSLASTILAKAKLHFREICTDEVTFATVHHFPLREIDFIVDGSVNWEYDTTATLSFSEYDFYSVALHELGHGHGMGHVIEPNKLLHYALGNGQKVRQISPNQLTGAIRVLDSSIVVFQWCPYGKSMQALTGDCNDVYSPIEEFVLFKNIAIYPNPFQNIFHLDFETQNREIMGLSIFNGLGQLIFEQDLGIIQGEHSQEINLPKTGIYYLLLQSEKGISTYKLIAE